MKTYFVISEEIKSVIEDIICDSEEMKLSSMTYLVIRESQMITSQKRLPVLNKKPFYTEILKNYLIKITIFYKVLVALGFDLPKVQSRNFCLDFSEG